MTDDWYGTTRPRPDIDLDNLDQYDTAWLHHHVMPYTRGTARRIIRNHVLLSDPRPKVRDFDTRNWRRKA